jgi:hypothetical protein
MPDYSAEDVFWKLNFALDTKLVVKTRDISNQFVDFSLTVQNRLNERLNFSKMFEQYKRVSPIIINEDRMQNLSKLFEEIAQLHCTEIPTVKTVSDLMNLESLIPFSIILGPFKNFSDARVSISVQCISKLNEIVRRYDVDEIIAFSVIISELNLRANLLLENEDFCSSYILALLPQEIHDFLFQEVVDQEVRKINDLLKAALLEAIEKAEWVDESTRNSAKKKVSMMAEQVQIPDLKFPRFDLANCSTYDFSFSFLENSLRIGQIIMNYPLEKFNRLEWPLNFLTFSPRITSIFESVDFAFQFKLGYANINAYYLPTSNKYVIPLGVLGIPFFGLNRTHSLNFGSIGTLAGHELSQYVLRFA